MPPYEEETQAELKDRIRDQEEKIRGKKRAPTRTEGGKAVPLGDYEDPKAPKPEASPMPSPNPAPTPSPSPTPKPSPTPTPDPSMPKDPGPDASLPERARYNKAMREWEASHPSPQKAAAKNLLKANP